MTRIRPALWASLVLTLGGVAGLAATSGNHVEAADHLDPPARVSEGATPDRAADIADVFAWHTGTGAAGRVTTVLTFAGPVPGAADQAITCDPNVLYEIHITRDIALDGDFDDDETIDVRFAEDSLGNCFVRVTGVPGMTGFMDVPTEIATTRGDVDVYAGLRDDPFFFDLEGFREMVDGLDGTPAYPAGMGFRMTNDRSFFTGMNSSAIVIEFPLLAVSSDSATPFRVWASTARIGS